LQITSSKSYRRYIPVACKLEFKKDTIAVSFDSAGENQDKGTAVFNLNGKLISKKIG
jgi:hypothetical protein